MVRLDTWTHTRVRVFGQIAAAAAPSPRPGPWELLSLGEERRSRVPLDFALIPDQAAALGVGAVVQLLGEVQLWPTQARGRTAIVQAHIARDFRGVDPALYHSAIEAQAPAVPRNVSATTRRPEEDVVSAAATAAVGSESTPPPWSAPPSPLSRPTAASPLGPSETPKPTANDSGRRIIRAVTQASTGATPAADRGGGAQQRLRQSTATATQRATDRKRLCPAGGDAASDEESGATVRPRLDRPSDDDDDSDRDLFYDCE